MIKTQTPKRPTHRERDALSPKTATRASGPRSAQPKRTQDGKGFNVKLDYLPLNG